MAAISSDGGNTWPARKLLEDDPNGVYCYTAMHFVDNAVLLGYSDWRRNGTHVLRIRRVGLDWLRPATHTPER